MPRGPAKMEPFNVMSISLSKRRKGKKKRYSGREHILPNWKRARVVEGPCAKYGLDCGNYAIQKWQGLDCEIDPF